jgi:hypothetical protein
MSSVHKPQGQMEWTWASNPKLPLPAETQEQLVRAIASLLLQSVHPKPLVPGGVDELEADR